MTIGCEYVNFNIGWVGHIEIGKGTEKSITKGVGGFRDQSTVSLMECTVFFLLYGGNLLTHF